MAWLECPVDEFGPLARELLGQGCAVRLQVTGRSMQPLIHSGDRVDIEPTTPDEVRVGDLALFALGERLFLHRVIDRRQVGGEVRLAARGDCNVTPEPEFGQAELLGVARTLRRGEAVIDLRSPAMRWIGWAAARSRPARRIALKLARHWPGQGAPHRADGGP